jgi:hypothetical protein
MKTGPAVRSAPDVARDHSGQRIAAVEPPEQVQPLFLPNPRQIAAAARTAAQPQIGRVNGSRFPHEHFSWTSHVRHLQ